MKPDDAGTGAALGGLKVSWSTAALIVMLTLAVWMYFWYQQLTLRPGDTAVVALVMTVGVLSGKWVWSRRERNQPKTRRRKK